MEALFAKEQPARPFVEHQLSAALGVVVHGVG